MGDELSNFSCNAAEWCGAVVERVMQDYSKDRIHVARKLNSPVQFRPFPVYPG